MKIVVLIVVFFFILGWHITEWIGKMCERIIIQFNSKSKQKQNKPARSNNVLEKCL